MSRRSKKVVVSLLILAGFLVTTSHRVEGAKVKKLRIKSGKKATLWTVVPL